MAEYSDEDTASTWYNDADIALRAKAVHKLALWTYSAHDFPGAQDYIAQLLGYADYHVMLVGWNADTRRKLEALCGPHGYAVYKAMLARKEV